MEDNIDNLVETIEVLNTAITKMNFDFDGLKEEVERLEKDRPFMVRSINQSIRKMNRIGSTLNKKMAEKQELDAELGAYQLKQQETKKDQASPDQTSTPTSEDGVTSQD